MAVLRRFGWTAGLAAAYTSQGVAFATGVLSTSASYRHLTSTGLGSAYGLQSNNTGISGIPTTAKWICFDAGKVATTEVWGFIFRRSAVNTFAVIINAAGFVELRRGNQSGTLLATSSVISPVGTFNWWSIEMVAAESGYCNVYWGSSTTPIVSYTGDTRAATSDGWDQVLSYNFFIRWNDIIIDDANRWAETFSMAAAANSDSLTTGWTPSAGGTIYGVVDEVPWSSTDYAAAAVDQDEFRCGHVALPSGISIVGASVLAYFARDGTINDVNLLIVSSGTASYSGPQAGGSAGVYGTASYLVDLDPATGAAWSVAALDAALIGARIEA